MTITKLYEMHFGVMALAFRDQMKNGNFAEMPFEERLGLLVDAEWGYSKKQPHNTAY